MVGCTGSSGNTFPDHWCSGFTGWWVYVLSGVLLYLRGGEKIRNWNTLPWYMLGAGVFGVILYLTINVTLPKLGSTWMVTLIITGQLIIGVIIDHFGWLGVPVHSVSLSRIIGVLALLGGGYMIARG